MPTYDYQCEECGITFERFQHFSEEPVKVCPECGGPVHRVIAPVGVIFKGSGFYVTDHSKNNATSRPQTPKEGEGVAPAKPKADKADKPAHTEKASTASGENK